MFNIIRRTFFAIPTALLFAFSPLLQIGLTQTTDENFSTEYEITYEILESGTTKVIQKTKIKNNSSEVFPTSYSLTIKNISISKVEGSDSEGSLDIVVNNPTDSITKLSTQFNEQVVGEGAVTEFEISYLTDDIATKAGEVWSINIPKVDVLELTARYDVKLLIPRSLGQKLFLTPDPFVNSLTDNHYEYLFNKEVLQGNNISGAFGKNQILSFKLIYNLENPSLFSREMEIALPPTIPQRQQIEITNLDPPPFKIQIDRDGNTIAYYKVPKKSSISIEAIGITRLLSRQINPEFGAKLETIPQEIAETYTKPQPYWETEGENVSRIAKNLYDKDLTVSQNAQKVYDYILNFLAYDYEIEERMKTEPLTRKGANYTLGTNDPVACMEFTDSFIAISRAMGIPAREINGYAISTEDSSKPLSVNFGGGDTLHSWPEFYDPNFGWVQIDPTWGDTSGIDYFTKIDTSHFAFVIKGTDSEWPLPAGAYKSDFNTQTVFVDFISGERLSLGLFDSGFDLFEKRGKYIIENTGGTTLFVGRNKTQLPPFSAYEISKKDADMELVVKNFAGEKMNMPNKASDETQNYKSINNVGTSTLVYAFLAGLVLYAIVFVLAVSPKAQKKVSDLLHRLPRGRGPLPNRN